MHPTRALQASFFALALCLCAFAQEKTMELLAPSTGWALGNGRLFWTTNNGENWTDITPQRPTGATIADVFFRDQINGWVLLESHLAEDMIGLELATTTDGGHIWSFADVPIPKQFPDELSGAAWVDFVDADHGWVVLKNHTSSAFNTARLFHSADGGRTWHELPQTPLGEPVIFSTPIEGWLGGGGGSQSLYRTSDGGKTWIAADPPQPAGLVQPVLLAYGTLQFADAKHAVIPVTFSPLHGQSVMGLFSTSDGGSTWKVGQVLELPNRYNEAAPLSATLDSTLLFVRGARITTLGPDNAEVAITIGGVSPDSDFNEINFANATNGWFRTSDGKLLATTDGGRTLTWLVPGSAPRALPPSRLCRGCIIQNGWGLTSKSPSPPRRCQLGGPAAPFSTWGSISGALTTAIRRSTKYAQCGSTPT